MAAEQPVQNPVATTLIGIFVLLFAVGLLYVGYRIGTTQPTPYIPPPPTATPESTPGPTPDQTPKPTTDPSTWITYQNTIYYYSIKHPRDWFIYDKGTYDSSTTGDGVFRDPKKFVVVSSQEISRIYPGDFSDPAGVMIQVVPPITEQDFDTETFITENVQINGNSALKVVSIDKNILSDPTTRYFINHHGTTYLIEHENTDYKGSHKAIFDQIIQTFTLTNTAATPKPTASPTPTPSPLPTPTPSPSPSPTPFTGSVSGTFYNDDTNEPLETFGFDITLKNLSTTASFHKTTASEWEFDDLPPGRYRLSVIEPDRYEIRYISCVNGCDAYDTDGCSFTFNLSPGESPKVICKYHLRY